MLAGDGGDELFGGNSRYASDKLFTAYEHVPALVKRALIEPLALGLPLSRCPCSARARGTWRSRGRPFRGGCSFTTC